MNKTKQAVVWLGLLLGLNGVAAAEIELSEEEGRTRVAANDESNLNILGQLAEHFGFAYTVSDDAWAGASRDFVKQGSAERILKALLVGENYIIGYGPREDGEGEGVASVRVLGEGREVTYAPPITAVVTDDGAETFNDPMQASGPTQPARSVGALLQRRAIPVTNASNASDGRANVQTGESRAVVSDDARDAPPLDATTGAQMISAEQQAELRRLTVQARSDVEHLAEALEAAEREMATENENSQ